MAYQVIARKYRPRRFSDVVGQDHVSQTLARAIEQRRIAHAYLFVGPRGTGKTTLARIFAKCLNCTGGPKADFPDDDPRVQEITEGRSLDVLEIDGASNRGIEEIRELRETVKYAPASSRFKIYIIDEVHMLTKEAFNALLKTLEEPPEHVKFMFATTEPEKVLPTILSRCQRFDLRRIPATLMIQHLAEIARLENVQIDSAALHAIARGSEGCMRDAESTLDQLISFCGEKIAEDDVLSMFGLAARAQLLGVARGILAGETETVLREFNALANSGKDLGRFLGDLLNHFRNLLLFQLCHGDLRLLEVSEAEAAALREQATLIQSAGLTRILDVLTDCESRFRDVASRKILVEVALLKAIEVRNAISIDSVLTKLRELQAASGSGSSAPAAAPKPLAPETTTVRPAALATSHAAPTISTTPVPAATLQERAPAMQSVAPSVQPIAASEIPGLQKLWERVVAAVGLASPFARTFLQYAQPVGFNRNTLTVSVDPDHFDLVDNPKNRGLIQTALAEAGIAGADAKFIAGQPISKPEPQPEPAPVFSSPAPAAPVAAAKPAAVAPAALEKEDFKNDPLIRQALEMFKGQIVAVQKT